MKIFKLMSELGKIYQKYGDIDTYVFGGFLKHLDTFANEPVVSTMYHPEFPDASVAMYAIVSLEEEGGLELPIPFETRWACPVCGGQVSTVEDTPGLWVCTRMDLDGTPAGDWVGVTRDLSVVRDVEEEC